MATTLHASANCDFLSRVIEQRRHCAVEVEFLHTDLVDEANGCFIEPVFRAVAFHSHCAPDSVPEDFCMRQDFRNAIHTLVRGKEDDSPRQRLWLNIRRSVRALNDGELVTVWAAPDQFGRLHYDENTLVELEVFRDWANRVQLPIVGPWTVRGQPSSTDIGYVASFAARPRHARVAEDLNREFGAELVAGCPRGWKHLIDFCVERHGLTRPSARHVVAFMDPRREHRGRPPRGQRLE